MVIAAPLIDTRKLMNSHVRRVPGRFQMGSKSVGVGVIARHVAKKQHHVSNL